MGQLGLVIPVAAETASALLTMFILYNHIRIGGIVYAPPFRNLFARAGNGCRLQTRSNLARPF